MIPEWTMGQYAGIVMPNDIRMNKLGHFTPKISPLGSRHSEVSNLHYFMHRGKISYTNLKQTWILRNVYPLPHNWDK
jgi:hypothetical protein